MGAHDFHAFDEGFSCGKGELLLSQRCKLGSDCVQALLNVHGLAIELKSLGAYGKILYNRVSSPSYHAFFGKIA